MFHSFYFFRILQLPSAIHSNEEECWESFTRDRNVVLKSWMRDLDLSRLYQHNTEVQSIHSFVYIILKVPVALS